MFVHVQQKVLTKVIDTEVQIESQFQAKFHLISKFSGALSRITMKSDYTP